MHETEIKPTIVQEEQLPAQVRPPILMQSEVVEANTHLPSMTVDATMKSVEVRIFSTVVVFSVVFLALCITVAR